MTTFFTEARQTLVPRGEVKHGPLPPLLVAMTLVTGLVDAFSYLVLGHVFVAKQNRYLLKKRDETAQCPHSAVFGWKDERFFVREAKDALHIQFVLIAFKTLA